MNTLGPIIHQLLERQSKVEIPGLGVFTTNYKPAELQFAGRTILPPDRTIEFSSNSKSGHDASFENFLIDNFGISSEAAKQILARFAEDVQTNLKKDRSSVIPGFGSLRVDIEGRPFFIPNQDQNYSHESFGLKTLVAETVYAKTRQIPDREVPVIPLHPFDSTKEEEAPEINSKRRILKWGAFAAVGAAFLMAVSGMYYLADGPFQFSAKQSDSGMRQEAGLVQVNTSVEPEIVPVEEDEVKAESPPEIPAVIETPVSEPIKTYFVVAGSFKESKGLGALSGKLEKEGYQVSQHLNLEKGMTRIAIGSFPDKNEAIEFLKKSQTRFSEELWVYSE